MFYFDFGITYRNISYHTERHRSFVVLFVIVCCGENFYKAK